MVGLDAVVAFTDEIERQLVRLEELAAARRAGRRAISSIAPCRRLRVFLDEIVNGAPPVPLTLFPEYEAMQQARGVEALRAGRSVLSRSQRRAPRVRRRARSCPRRASRRIC